MPVAASDDPACTSSFATSGVSFVAAQMKRNPAILIGNIWVPSVGKSDADGFSIVIEHSLDKRVAHDVCKFYLACLFGASLRCAPAYGVRKEFLSALLWHG